MPYFAIFILVFGNFAPNFKFYVMSEMRYNRIKAELAEQHLTSKWLAEKMGKSETTVSRWVSNKSQPSVEQLYEIACLLKVEVYVLLKSSIEK